MPLKGKDSKEEISNSNLRVFCFFTVYAEVVTQGPKYIVIFRVRKILQGML